MAFANPSVTDIIATTIQSRSKMIADNVTDNNGFLNRLSKRGNLKTVSGGDVIFQELSFAENANAGWYSGYDLLPVGISDVISAAQYDWRQFAVPIIISGLEELKNSGKERMIDLMEGRMSVAESTMANQISIGLYSDGSASGGKQLQGLDLAVSETPAVGTYGGIDPATAVGTFWRNYAAALDITAANVQTQLNLAWSRLVRGADRPDLILMGTSFWNTYVASLQAQQRFNSPTVGDAGFATIKFMDADVILDGGIGGACSDGDCFLLNTKYLFYRPHARRNMVPLSPNKRYATNQDAEVQILGWAGNMTCSGRQFQGRITDTTP